MSFSFRVANRIEREIASKRRPEHLIPLNNVNIRNKTICPKRPQRRISNSTYIGVSNLLIAFVSLYRLSSPKYVLGIFIYFWVTLCLLLSLKKLMETFGRMDVPLLNCRQGSGFDWKAVASKIISGTKKNFLKMEQIYLDMKNFSVLINQLVFFGLCERVFMLHQPVVSFYTLMFFNVIAYCVSYIKELIEREDWSMYVHVARSSNVRHLAMSATKIVLEWTKAITFIITLVFILLVAGLEKGLKNYSPGIPYLVITGIYYIISEKVFVDLICKMLDRMKLECFESLESLYLPFILKGIQIILSFIFTIICFLLGHARITVLSCFTNIRVRYRELDSNHWQPLVVELVRLMKYRCADRDELLKHDDVCAICLTPMKTARVTPCHHMFHADCLRRCLKQSFNQLCPICKQSLPSLTQ